MSGIWKINMLQNLTTKQDLNKLSFKKDDSFVARVLKLDGNSSEIILKLLDGRIFPAKVEGFINEPLDNYLFKFLVDGFEDGKMKIKLLESKAENNINEDQNKQNTIEELSNRLSFVVDSKDTNILKSMIKYNLPINEESFNEVKNLVDFIDKIKASPLEEDIFINKFLSSRNVEPDSIKGIFIKETLASFFNEAKKLDLNTILMMKESGVTFTEENIRSFINVASKDFNIFNEIEQVKSDVTKNINNTNNVDNVKIIEDNKNIGHDSIINNFSNLEAKSIVGNNSNIKSNDINEATITNKDIKDNESNTIEKNVNEIPKKLNVKDNNFNSELENKEKITSNDTLKSFIKEEVLAKEVKGKLISGNDKEFTLTNDLPKEQMVKDEIKEKLSLLKSSILEIIRSTDDGKNTASKVFQLLENKMQDFKMFNTINNDYFYLNVPMNIKEDQYDCKLIIKDERNRGKKLDSKNIKIATSITTLNMKTVDSYITVMNNNVNIEIQAEANFTKLLEQLKGKLLESLGNDKHLYNISIKNKKEEFSLLKCREFFSDNDFSSLNVMV